MSQVALVVDINHYQFLPPLRSPLVPGKPIPKVLSQYGNFQVKTLPRDHGEPGTVSQRELEEMLLALLLPKGNHIPRVALLYFTGHILCRHQGMTEYFLATSETHPAQGCWGIRWQWIEALLRQSPINHLIVWLDGCYGEAIAWDFQGMIPKAEGSYSLLAACRTFQAQKQGVEVTPSYLATALLQGLEPRSQTTGRVTTLTLTQFVASFLAEYRQSLTYLNLGEPILLTHYPVSNPLWEPPPKVTDIPCPYPGLRPFQVQESAYFLGRSRELALLLNQVRTSPGVILLGNSGVGKTSLLQAGLMAALAQGDRLSGTSQAEVRYLQPGPQPLQSLALALLDPQLSNAEKHQQLNQIQPLIHQGGEGFCNLLAMAFVHPLYLIVDQFEEIFSLCQNSLERETFWQCLWAMMETTAKERGPHRVVIALRSDYLGHCLELGPDTLRELLQTQLIILPPLTGQVLREVIAAPAQQVKLPLQEDLVNVLYQDVQKLTNPLPLLQYTLFQLWRRGKNQGLLLSTYRELGGVEDCLDRVATEAFEQLSEMEQAAAYHLFVSLLPTPATGLLVAHRRINQELATPRYPLALMNLVVQKLAHAQLFITEPVPLAVGIDPPMFIRLVHESIPQYWRLLQKWLRDRDRQFNQQQILEEKARDWQNAPLKTQKSYLLTGQALKEAQKIQAQGRTGGENQPLSQVAEVFIQASLRHQQGDRLKLTALIAFIPFVFLIGGAIYLYRQHQFQQYWQIVKEHQDQRESRPRIKALETLNQMGEKLSDQNFNQINLQGINLSKANLSKSRFVESFLTGANLTGANLTGANLQQTELTGANLTGANLTEANLTESYLTGANLTGANLQKADLQQANLMRINLSEGNLSQANLSKAELTGAILTQANLQKANLQQAKLWGSDLSDTNLSQANLQQADLTRANFAGAKLTEIQLKGANITNADFSTASDLPLTQIKTACGWQNAVFTEEVKQQLTKINAPSPAQCP